jgi:hypothetical protein
MRKPKDKTKAKTTAKSKTNARKKTKATRRSTAKRRRDRNTPGDQPLSFDLPAKDAMTAETGAAAKHPVHDSIDLVLAECDKVAAVLTELARDEGMPPLTIKPVETADHTGAAKAGWAVVSVDPHRPLTEGEAKRIVAAMGEPRTSAPIGIAAE